MVFSSAIFLFAFLPIVLLLYCLAGQRLKNGILLAASLLFYAYGEPKFVFVMLASIVLNYAFAMLIELPGYGSKRWRRDWLLAALACNLGILFVFKYLNFFGHMVGKALHIDLQLPSIALPIGISFFTFQALSYVVDVYRGTTRVQRNPFSLALYISFFPQLIAGPIVRYSTIAEQIDDRKVTPEKLSQGVQRFIAGFCKKVLLANNVALVAEAAFDVHGEKSVALLWVGSLAYTLQIFFDFCGYSDMAIGLGKMFGFEFEENFNYPYMAKSVTDFWHRWHISLSQWFRDYVYFPLGGSRVTPARHIFNLFVVWLFDRPMARCKLHFPGLGHDVLCHAAGGKVPCQAAAAERRDGDGVACSNAAHRQLRLGAVQLTEYCGRKAVYLRDAGSARPAVMERCRDRFFSGIWCVFAVGGHVLHPYYQGVRPAAVLRACRNCLAKGAAAPGADSGLCMGSVLCGAGGPQPIHLFQLLVRK